MSGLILFIVAVALLGVAIYSRCRTSKSGAPVSYLSIKRRNTFRSHRFLLISLPSCTVLTEAKTKAGLRACLRSVYASEPMTPRPAPL